jgi:hypothetical protein
MEGLGKWKGWGKMEGLGKMKGLGENRCEERKGMRNIHCRGIERRREC